jgi:hypothetical protein
MIKKQAGANTQFVTTTFRPELVKVRCLGRGLGGSGEQRCTSCESDRRISRGVAVARRGR